MSATATASYELLATSKLQLCWGHFPQAQTLQARGPRLTPEQNADHSVVTFLGEKLSAVLPSSNHFAWDLPKELHDQSDVVCPPPHTSQRGTGRVSALRHAHTRPHRWLRGTDTHTAASEHGRRMDGRPLALWEHRGC